MVTQRAEQRLGKVVDIEDTLAALAPICLVAKSVDPDAIEVRVVGQPRSRPIVAEIGGVGP